MRSHAIFATLTVALTPFAARADIPAPCSGPEHTQQQAGYAQCVAWYAVPVRSPKDGTGYVGGGCQGRKGEPRRPDEGVFGWDYVGCGRYPGRVFLNWCHCHKQPPPGPYRTDGPHVPDIFSLHPLQRAAESKRHACPEH
jgi:hypothetical protein